MPKQGQLRQGKLLKKKWQRNTELLKQGQRQRHKAKAEAVMQQRMVAALEANCRAKRVSEVGIAQEEMLRSVR